MSIHRRVLNYSPTQLLNFPLSAFVTPLSKNEHFLSNSLIYFKTMKNKVFLCLIALCIAFASCKDATTSAPAKTAETDNAARNKATFIKVNALYNEKKLDEAAQFYSPNFERKTDKNTPGQKGVKARWEATYKTWPDNQAIIEQIVAEGDWVMLRAKATATHTQVVMGVKPTNKKLSADYWEAIRFNKEGLIEESWGMLDNAAMMQQLGLLSQMK
jgi:predicted ester cyclase